MSKKQDGYSWIQVSMELADSIASILNFKSERSFFPCVEGFPLFSHAEDNSLEEVFCISLGIFDSNWEQLDKHEKTDKKKGEVNYVKETVIETIARISQFLSRSSSDGTPELFEMLGVLLLPYKSDEPKFSPSSSPSTFGGSSYLPYLFSFQTFFF